MKAEVSLQTSLLFLIFLVLKLTGIISWSWWWVTAPIWIPIILVILCVAFAVTFAGRGI
jgi:hypothetical protein